MPTKKSENYEVAIGQTPYLPKNIFTLRQI